MFLHVLDPAERDLFADAAWMLIHLDGEVDPREEALFDEMHVELGLQVRPSLVSEAEIVERLADIDSGTVARVLLLELAGVATADEVIHEDEIRFLRRAASVLNLSDAVVDDMVEFAGRAQNVWREGRDLVLDE